MPKPVVIPLSATTQNTLTTLGCSTLLAALPLYATPSGLRRDLTTRVGHSDIALQQSACLEELSEDRAKSTTAQFLGKLQICNSDNWQHGRVPCVKS